MPKFEVIDIDEEEEKELSQGLAQSATISTDLSSKQQAASSCISSSSGALSAVVVGVNDEHVIPAYEAETEQEHSIHGDFKDNGLYFAVACNDLKRIRELLALETTTKDFVHNAMHGAKSVEALKMLIEAGGDMFGYASCGATPLLHAASAPDASAAVIKYLIEEHNAPIGGQGRMQYTPLHNAAFSGRLDIAEYLISKGADVNARNANGITPLMCATEEDHADFVEFLLKHNASVDIQDKNGHDAIYHALERGAVDSTRVLIMKGGAALDPFSTCDRPYGCGAPLMYATVLDGLPECALFFLEESVKQKMLSTHFYHDHHTHNHVDGHLLMDGCNHGSSGKKKKKKKGRSKNNNNKKKSSSSSSNNNNNKKKKKKKEATMATAAATSTTTIAATATTCSSDPSAHDHDGREQQQQQQEEDQQQLTTTTTATTSTTYHVCKHNYEHEYASWTPLHVAVLRQDLVAVRAILEVIASKPGGKALAAKLVNMRTDLNRIAPIHIAAGLGMTESRKIERRRSRDERRRRRQTKIYKRTTTTTTNGDNSGAATAAAAAAATASSRTAPIVSNNNDNSMAMVASSSSSSSSSSSTTTTTTTSSSSSSLLLVPAAEADQCQGDEQKAVQMMELLMSYGAEVDVYDGYQRHTIHYAISAGNVAAFRKVLAVCPAAMVALDCFQQSPLHFAVHYCNHSERIAVRIIHALIESIRKLNLGRASVETYVSMQEQSGGMTALQRAIVAVPRSLDVIRVLVEAGTNLELKSTVYQWTALAFAADTGDEDVVRYLVSKGARLDARDVHGKLPHEIAEAGEHNRAAAYLREQYVLFVNRMRELQHQVSERKGVCAFCKRVEPAAGKFKHCGNCGTKYCSVECQTRDWKERNHKAVCIKPSLAAAAATTTTTTRST